MFKGAAASFTAGLQPEGRERNRPNPALRVGPRDAKAHKPLPSRYTRPVGEELHAIKSESGTVDPPSQGQGTSNHQQNLFRTHRLSQCETFLHVALEAQVLRPGAEERRPGVKEEIDGLSIGKKSPDVKKKDALAHRGNAPPFPAIFAQVSRRVTVRLNTRMPSDGVSVSTQK